MDLINLEDLRAAMRLAGLKPAKSLGQHFLIDQDSLRAIIEAAKLQPDDTVLEVGPGLGTMTQVLSTKVKRVVAVEADVELAALLAARNLPNVEVDPSDILRYDLRSLPPGYQVVANIPYYLTAKLLRLLLESPNRPKRLTLLIQKEVAERLVAAPGQLSVLGLSAQYYSDVKIIAQVERHKFWPAPKVDSAVVVLDILPTPRFEAEPAKLFRLIKAGFGEKRKQLKNSLAGGLNAGLDLTQELLNEAQVKPTARAQELKLADWQRLYKAAAGRGLL